MGRVLLADLPNDQVLDIFECSGRSRSNEYTVRSGPALLEALEEVRKQGWALVDQELHIGIRSLAAPCATSEVAPLPP